MLNLLNLLNIIIKLNIGEEEEDSGAVTTRHSRLFSVASGDRQVNFGSRGYFVGGRHDARANSLRAGRAAAVRVAKWYRGDTFCTGGGEGAHCLESPLAELDQRA